jgi:hypothetical protein
MHAPEWLKPALYGAAAGAVALAIAGFSWGGWMTSGGANRMAAELAKTEVVAALVPICVEQARVDPNSTVKLAQLQDATTNQRNSLLIETGWATMPGATDSDRTVVTACMRELAAQF